MNAACYSKYPVLFVVNAPIQIAGRKLSKTGTKKSLIDRNRGTPNLLKPIPLSFAKPSAVRGYWSGKALRSRTRPGRVELFTVLLKKGVQELIMNREVSNG